MAHNFKIRKVFQIENLFIDWSMIYLVTDMLKLNEID